VEATVNGDEERKSGPRKRIIFGIVGTIVAILLIIWGIKWFLYARVHESTDDARVDANAVLVNSKIGERINQILVSTNQEVKKGQLLIVLDDTDERARLAQAQAGYDLAAASQNALTQQGRGGVQQASAQIPAAQAGVTAASAQLGAAQASLPAAQAAYAKASADLHRAESLVSTGDIPKQQLDAARAEAAEAAAQLDAAQSNVSSAGAGVTGAEQKITVAQGAAITAGGQLAQATDPSQVEAQRAVLELAKQNLKYTKIYSAIDGYVGEKSVEIGQTVGPGMTLLTLIPHNIFITANYKETQLGDMHPGQPADISVDAYKGITFHGHLLSINPASQNTYALIPAQNSTGNFVKVTQRIPVKISVDDQRSDMPLRPGMSVETSVKVR
jgi:membrane fusion protein (multidrug efflux system)